jgi:hypothetical protein
LYRFTLDEEEITMLPLVWLAFVKSAAEIPWVNPEASIVVNAILLPESVTRGCYPI